MPFLHDHSKPLRSRVLEEMTKKQGLRHAIFNVVGDRYIGEWKDNFKSGKGALLTRFRQLYEGDFEEGYRHGFGVLAYEKPNKVFVLEYRGGWKRGRMDGFGLRKFRDGGVYIGDWKRGKRHGYGLMWYPNEFFYAGDWVKDMRDGMGMLVRPDINRYEGAWMKDMKHGRGKFLHLVTGQLQRGVWTRDWCVTSTVNDIKYRQTAPKATPIPIQLIELVNMKDLVESYDIKALEEIARSCLMLNASLEDCLQE